MKVDHLKWGQKITLRDGTVTPGVPCEELEYERHRFPRNVSQWTVADLGTLDGFWAVEAKNGGAEVVAFDWMDRPTARLVLGDYGIPYVTGHDLNVPINWPHRYVLVLFYGILYHLKNPMQGLVNAWNLVEPDGLLIVESACQTLDCARIPDDVAAMWIPPNGYYDDRSNYCMPNKAGLRQMCAHLDGCEQFDEIFTGGRMTIVCHKKI